MNICSANECSKASTKRGFCENHYRLFMRNGDANIRKKKANGDGFIAQGYPASQINGVKKFDHVRIAEEVLGRPLPPGAVVHHANGVRDDNRKENLVICPSRAYHNLLHKRIRAAEATGDPSSERCVICGSYENQSVMKKRKRYDGFFFAHPDCEREKNRRKK